MRRLPAIAAALLLLAAAAPAAGARSVPPRFFGVMANGPLELPGVDVDAEGAVMRRSGVEAIRVPIRWPALQPVRRSADLPPADRARFTLAGGVPTDFTQLDRQIAAAARNGLDVLGLLLESPAWAASDPADSFSPPRDRAAYTRVLRALIGRYGPRGSFWTAHPALPRRPVRSWQIWNEPSLPRYFAAGRSWAAAYERLLRAAYAAAHAADPGATVVSAGLPNYSWRDLEALYRAGLRARGHFDALAVHPFTGRPADSVRILERVRAVLDRHGDRRAPLWVTEVSWPSARGKAQSNQRWVTTPAGEAARLREVYAAYARSWRRLRLARAYWYAWATTDRDSPNAFDYAGLRTYGPDGRFRDKPALAAYRAAARRWTR